MNIEHVKMIGVIDLNCVILFCMLFTSRTYFSEMCQLFSGVFSLYVPTKISNCVLVENRVLEPVQNKYLKIFSIYVDIYHCNIFRTNQL